MGSGLQEPSLVLSLTAFVSASTSAVASCSLPETRFLLVAGNMGT